MTSELGGAGALSCHDGGVEELSFGGPNAAGSEVEGGASWSLLGIVEAHFWSQMVIFGEREARLAWPEESKEERNNKTQWVATNKVCEINFGVLSRPLIPISSSYPSSSRNSNPTPQV